MSWNNALPMWMWAMEFEEFTAKLTGAMEGEWHPRFSRALPKSLLYIYETKN